MTTRTPRFAAPVLIAHRTTMGLCPENTIVGIEAAIASGVDGVEIDVRATRDGVPVLMHDASLERTTGDPRDVEAVTLEELRLLRVLDPHGDIGPQPIPTFAEALEATAATHLVIEVKQTGIEDLVARAVREADALGRTSLCAFDADVCAASAEVMPDVPVSLLAAPNRDVAEVLAQAADLGLAGVSLHYSMVDEQLVREAHDAGLTVATWTVNDEADVRRMHAVGVDLICGDYPARLVEVVRGA
ncbi:MAG: glycerophosphodiester phosphodiesterase [Chloroflexi bacterium]|nr:glycerophosphodiester phosphodiesterase [Chloroflexota bacterium]